MSKAEEVTHPDLNSWTFRTLLVHVTSLMDSSAQRIVTLIEANDKRYQERAEAQEKSTAIALFAAEKAVNAALTASDKAVQKAEENQQRVNAGQNEFRGALADQTKAAEVRAERFATTENLNVLLGAVNNRLKNLEEAGAAGSGRLTITTVLWGIIAVIAAGVMVYVITHGIAVAR